MKKTKTKKSLIKRIGDVLFAVLIVVLSLFIIVSLYCKKTGRQLFSYSVLWVMTNSMETTIPEQSYILVKKVDASTLKKGDIITFLSRDPLIKGQFNTHRIVDIIGDNERFVTRGDNNISNDEYEVYAEDVVYIYKCNLPVLTVFGRAYSTPYGLMITVMFICVCASVFLLIINKQYKAEDKQKEIDKLVQEEVKRLEAENAVKTDKVDK